MAQKFTAHALSRSGRRLHTTDGTHDANSVSSGYGYGGSFDIRWEDNPNNGLPRPRKGRKALAALALLAFATSAHAAERNPCRTIRHADGGTARMRTTASGNLSACEYDFRLVLKVGAGRKPVEIRTATPDRCHVWVSESALAKDKGLIDEAWSQCVDASQAAEEKENAKK